MHLENTPQEHIISSEEDIIEKIMASIANSLPRGWPLGGKDPQQQLKIAIHTAISTHITSFNHDPDVHTQISLLRNKVAELEKKLKET
jgi:hypothetical protein